MDINCFLGYFSGKMVTGDIQLKNGKTRSGKLKKFVAAIIPVFLIMIATTPTWCDENKVGTNAPPAGASPDPDHRIEDMSKRMTPMFGDMVQSMMQGKLKVFAQPETTTLLAKFVKNFYDDLIEQGFTKEEALRIVIAFGFPAIQ